MKERTLTQAVFWLLLLYSPVFSATDVVSAWMYDRFEHRMYLPNVQAIRGNWFCWAHCAYPGLTDWDHFYQKNATPVSDGVAFGDTFYVPTTQGLVGDGGTGNTFYMRMSGDATELIVAGYYSHEVLRYVSPQPENSTPYGHLFFVTVCRRQPFPQRSRFPALFPDRIVPILFPEVNNNQTTFRWRPDGDSGPDMYYQHIWSFGAGGFYQRMSEAEVNRNFRPPKFQWSNPPTPPGGLGG